MKVPVTTNHSHYSNSNTTTTTTTPSAAAATVSSNPKPLPSDTATRNSNVSFLHSPPAAATNPTSTTTTTAAATVNNHISCNTNIGAASATLSLPSPAPLTVSAHTPSVSTTNTNNQSVDLDNLEGWDSILSELGLNDDSSGSAKLPLSQFGDPHHHPPQLSDFPIVSHHSSFDHQQQLPSIIPTDFFSAADQFPYNNNFAPQIDQNQGHNNPPSQSSNYSNGLDFVDDLIRAAQLFEVNESNQCQQILARLNQQLRSPIGKPLNRSAFYFKEALSHSLITAAAESSGSTRRLTSYEIVQTIRAHKTYSGSSPIPLFSTFTANQAILEAIDGSSYVHIVDFDIGFGGHWASLMREVVDKSATDPTRSIFLRITAIVPEEFAVESRLVRENLTQFASDLSIVNFQIDFVLTRTFEILSFKAVKFVPGEKIAVHLAPITINRLGSRANISKFVGDLRGVAPAVVVVVDREVGMDTGTASFSVGFYTGLEFYTAMLESLDAAAAGSGAGIVGSGSGAGAGGGSDWVKRIETYLIRPRILAAVEGKKGVAAGTGWREAFVGLGMKAVGFSQFADFQAECLLRRAQIVGFHLAKRQGEMLLCWHDRPLVATSAWRCS